MAVKVFEQVRSYIGKYRSYRKLISQPNVKPISFTEWLLGRISGKLLVAATAMAHKRGDYESLKAALLTTWAGNQNTDRKIIPDMSPAELSKAVKENRVRIIIDETNDTERK